jgi:ubiquinone/menaquinone biosynthesis C-methylase UbiE
MSEGRVDREARAYDDGQVFAESRKLQTRFRHVFFCPNSRWLTSYVGELIAQKAPGGVVLDYGCFTGDLYPALAPHKPARVVGIDISQAGIDQAKARFGDAVEYLKMDAHHTTFPDATFDLVVGTSILHHLDWEPAIREVSRILKPGGVAVFTEPLGGNPAAKLIRKLTPKARTRDEKPVERAQILFADRIIGRGQHRFGNLVSVPLAMTTSLLVESPDNVLLRAADPIDRLLAKTPIKYWMRQVVLSWVKT